MALPLTIYNPQTSEPITSANPTVGSTITYGGNVIGSGSTSTSASGASTPPDISTILIYGAIGLFFVFILERIGD